VLLVRSGPVCESRTIREMFRTTNFSWRTLTSIAGRPLSAWFEVFIRGPRFVGERPILPLPVRSVAFPDDEFHPRDEKQRPAGVEMNRQLTQEEIRLAAAGYEHITKDKPGPQDTKFGDVDITEHSQPIHEVEGLLQTSFNWVDPAQSRGLTAAEAEARLKRDGPNALTPPKKKSALQKVCMHSRELDDLAD